MRTLFFKIFLWFWAAMALVILSMFLVTWLSLDPHLHRELGDPFKVFGIEAIRHYEQDGQAGLNEYLNFLDQNLKRPSFLLDREGNEISGRPIPDGLKNLIPKIQRREEPRIHEVQYVLIPITTDRGQNYFFASELPAFPGLIASTPRKLGIQILIVLLSAGLGCYWLAYYLTAPIERLREATHKLATGNLSTRVGKTIAKRKDEVSELGRDFDWMAERIETLINSQHRLLGDISHELRSPLTRLNLALGVARRRAGDVALSAHDRIEREVERLNDLISQLLTLTELESGEQSIHQDQIKLAELIAEIAADAEFEAHNQKRSVKILQADSCVISGDERLLRSAIENVVRNAIRYTAEGTAVEITLARHQEAQELPIHITVRDHGSGVPEESLEQLFRPFYRVADARDRESGGVGLGLSITERAVRIHGGTVIATNAPDQGLVIELQLPATISNSSYKQNG